MWVRAKSPKVGLRCDRKIVFVLETGTEVSDEDMVQIKKRYGDSLEKHIYLGKEEPKHEDISTVPAVSDSPPEKVAVKGVTVALLPKLLKGITSVDELEEMLEAEKAGDNRVMAIRLIEDRIKKV